MAKAKAKKAKKPVDEVIGSCLLPPPYEHKPISAFFKKSIDEDSQSVASDTTTCPSVSTLAASSSTLAASYPTGSRVVVASISTTPTADTLLEPDNEENPDKQPDGPAQKTDEDKTSPEENLKRDGKTEDQPNFGTKNVGGVQGDLVGQKGCFDSEVPVGCDTFDTFVEGKGSGENDGLLKPFGDEPLHSRSQPGSAPTPATSHFDNLDARIQAIAANRIDSYTAAIA